MARTKKRALWVATESTYGSDPSTNGSAYLWIPSLSVGDLKDNKAVLETNYFTGRNFPTKPLAGQDGWEFDFEIPLNGMLTAAGNAVAASSVTDDWLDKLLTHIFGVQYTSSGQTVASGTSTSTTLDLLTSDIYDAQQIVAVFEASVPSGNARTQWNLLTTSADPYTVSQQWETTPATAATSYGTKGYVYDDDGGATLSFFYLEDDIAYLCLGGRVTAASITGEVGQIVRMKLTVRGDTKTLDAGHSSRPAVGTGPANPALICLTSPVCFGNTRIATRKFEIDLGITTAVIESTAAANGRAGDELIIGVPSLTIEPLRTDANLNFKRNMTFNSLQCQIGAGVLASGVLNTMCAFWDTAYVSEVNVQDENGRVRQSMKFMLADNVVSATVVRPFQLARA